MTASGAYRRLDRRMADVADRGLGCPIGRISASQGALGDGSSRRRSGHWGSRLPTSQSGKPPISGAISPRVPALTLTSPPCAGPRSYRLNIRDSADRCSYRHTEPSAPQSSFLGCEADVAIRCFGRRSCPELQTFMRRRWRSTPRRWRSERRFALRAREARGVKPLLSLYPMPPIFINRRHGFSLG